MPVPAIRRLPGIRFEVPPPVLDDILPRMDIAAFVGFAASGPIHVPVAVESTSEFERIFGADAALAWDPTRGESIRAQLAPAVRAFFRNGGRRCWVVRVAEEASTNYFQIPGMARLSGDRMAPAFARSRSAGSWSDGVRVGATLMTSPVDVVHVSVDDADVEMEATRAAPADLEPGDLLRLEFGNGHLAFVSVAKVKALEASPPTDRPHVSVRGRANWFRETFQPLPGSGPAHAIVYTAARNKPGSSETFAGDPVAILNEPAEWTVAGAPATVHLILAMRLDEAPQSGSLLSVDLGTEQLWVSVRDIGLLATERGGTDRLRVTGRAMWRVNPPPPLVDPGLTRCERLEIALWARSDDRHTTALEDLGLTPGHRRYWADLQDDDARYGELPRGATPRPLWAERFFPLAGAGPGDAIYLPLDVPLSPDRSLGAVRQPRTALERDGLSSFSPALFLDPDLVMPLTDSVMAAAEHLRYTSATPRRLRGIHAALEVDEATIVAVPDAAHPGWSPRAIEDPPKPQRSRPLARPDWGTFIDCGVRIIKPPRWTPRFQQRAPIRFDAGAYTLEWSAGHGQIFVVEEAHEPDWSDAAVIYSGSDSRVSMYGRPQGTYYYRVRATVPGLSSNWSRGITVVVSGGRSWQVRNAQLYSADTLTAVQRGLLRMCAARGDLFAILSLPEHFRPGDALAHVTSLKNPAAAQNVVADQQRPTVPALGAGESRVFSYAAVYHPWAFVREQPGSDGLARVAPDGSMAGVLAARALARGAWIAPANEALRGVIALSSAVGRDAAQLMLDASVNVISQEPRGFVPLGANTLSDDADLTAINVRRLLGLLRRLALREGVTYVFEPHDATFRRTVQRGFEALLTRMFERGAFAGRTTTAAFQVTTNESVNTTANVDHGRFMVELRVAPSMPMTFLTVRLVQSGDRILVLEER